ncbi:MAG: translation initiation factor IF-5A [Nanoarchaeota archaeon]|nr:translation initiation factor IF-5A [Nanoarchaeota archaeon]
MVLKLINATEAKPGSTINIDGEPYIVRSNDISKTGKHGHAKCRIEAVGVFNSKKKVLAVPGHERFEVPMINKKKGQILNVSNGTASVMDLESFETLELSYPKELKGELAPEKQVEYWDVEGKKGIRRVL